MRMKGQLDELRNHLATVQDLTAASYLLSWDQQTYMPEGAVELRSEQLATLSRLTHEQAVAPALGRLLDQLGGQFDPDSEEGALVRVAQRDFDRDTKLPTALVGELSRVTALAEAAWGTAREKRSWKLFAPHLERILELKREAAAHYGYQDHPFDALLDVNEPGATKAQLEGLFAELKRELVPLVKAVAAQAQQEDPPRDAPLRNAYDEARQLVFGREVVTRFGFDWSRGRQDRSRHPFCSATGPDDVRLTTRVDPDWLSPALFASLHEAGHGLYEQGIEGRFQRSPLAGGCSLGVHESQSRLWENLVGRSRGFWEYFFPRLRRLFRRTLDHVDLEDFYRAINAVAPSFIRVEADELTYNLHVLLRFEIELALLEGSLSVAEVPAAWNAKMEEYLGLTPADDAEGALQDVHWSAGLVAYFPTYTLGNVLSVQLFDAAVAAHPEIPGDIACGRFSRLLAWLREHVHRHGRRFEPQELVRRATGRPLETGPYLAYLKSKYGELYALD